MINNYYLDKSKKLCHFSFGDNVSILGAKVSIINQTIVNSLSRTSREVSNPFHRQLSVLLWAYEYFPLQNFEKTASRYHKQKRFFEDDFIVTPLNISNEHWVLLIVCYPGLILFSCPIFVGFCIRYRSHFQVLMDVTTLILESVVTLDQLKDV